MRLNFMVLSIAAFAFVLTVLLFSKAGKADDAKRRMIKSITKDDVVKIEHEELEQSFSKRFLAPILNKLKEFSANQSKKKKEKNEKVVDEKKLAKVKETERLLRMSGMHTSYQNYNFSRHRLCNYIGRRYYDDCSNYLCRHCSCNVFAEIHSQNKSFISSAGY